VTERIAPRFRRVVAVDYSRRSLEVLQEKPWAEGLLLVQADARRLPFRSSAFDAAVCPNTLQHLNPDGGQQAAADELSRVAKPNAPVAATVHHWAAWKRSQGWPKSDSPKHHDGVDFIFRFERSDLAKLFPAATIRAVGFYSLGRIPKISVPAMRMVTRLFGERLARQGQGHMLLAAID
jgi:hypothetical protein